MSLPHHKLVAWQRADDLFIDVHRLTYKRFPRTEQCELGSQLRRAAFSVASRRWNRRAGFSLAELVVSVGILVLMLSLVGQVFHLTVRSTGKVTGKIHYGESRERKIRGTASHQEVSELRAVDVVLPTKEGFELRLRRVAQPSEHQKILLERLGLELPSHLDISDL